MRKKPISKPATPLVLKDTVSEPNTPAQKAAAAKKAAALRAAFIAAGEKTRFKKPEPAHAPTNPTIALNKQQQLVKAAYKLVGQIERAAEHSPHTTTAQKILAQETQNILQSGNVALWNMAMQILSAQNAKRTDGKKIHPVLKNVTIESPQRKKLDLSGLDMRGIISFGLTIRHADLSDTLFNHAVLNKAAIEGCSYDEFRGPSFVSAHLNNHATIVGLRREKHEPVSDPVKERLIMSARKPVSFRNADLRGATLSDCHLQLANFTGAVFGRRLDNKRGIGEKEVGIPVRDKAALNGCHMNGAKIVKLDFRLAEVSGCKGLLSRPIPDNFVRYYEGSNASNVFDAFAAKVSVQPQQQPFAEMPDITPPIADDGVIKLDDHRQTPRPAD